MNTLILAAGFGTRMRPLTERIPKVLLPVCGMSLLEHALRLFHDQGLGPLLVNAHYLCAQIEAFRTLAAVPFDISYEREKILGPGGGIVHARHFCEKTPIFCVANAEPLKKLPLQPIMERFAQTDAWIGLVSVAVDSGGTIFAYAGSSDYAGTNADRLDSARIVPYDFIGITLYRREIFDVFRSDDFAVTPVWRRTQEQGHRVVIIEAPRSTWWHDVGNPLEFAQVYFDVLDGLAALPIPEGMTFDKERRRAYPTGLSASTIAQLGDYVWFENSALEPGSFLSRTIVLKGGVVPPGRITNLLGTPWGNCQIG